MQPFEENIRDGAIDDEVKRDFLDYSMSVIVSRALPDVRDGLKPVQRRILYSMHDQNMVHEKAAKKSARIVGDVIGKYHPHGDSAVYETMVRMGQPWNYLAPLVEGQGNFGSMQGDSAAAMRYTEARMQKITAELLRGIDKETVPFVPNYDGNEKEPSVLPSRFPHLLVNGSSGIAVGMATNFAPHNIKESCAAVMAQLENEDIPLDELMEHIKGPDFPTGAEIRGGAGIRTAYETGRGSVVLRAKTHVEVIDGQSQIVITEIPYQTNLGSLINKIKEIQTLHDEWAKKSDRGKHSKKAPKALDFHISDGVNDESEGDSIRIVIALKPSVTPEIVLNHLYKHTLLQSSFSFNHIALVPNANGTLEPKMLPLKEMIRQYILHQVEVVTRETEHDLFKTEARLRNVDALVKAMDRLDEVISIIRTHLYEEAKEKLSGLLSIDDAQAAFVLQRPLRSLSSGDQEKFRTEQRELNAVRSRLTEILGDETLIKAIIKEDLIQFSNVYGEDRRTALLPPVELIRSEDLIENVKTVVTVTKQGYIKSTAESSYRSQRRNGRGVKGMETNDQDFVCHLEVMQKLDSLLIFTDKGKVYTLRGYEIPESKPDGKGTPIANLLTGMEQEESIQATLSIQEFSDKQYLLFTTKKGLVKKTPLNHYANIRRNGIHAIKLQDGDAVVGVCLTNGQKPITLITKRGQSITFNEREVKSVSRFSRGVKGIDLYLPEDEIIAADIHEEFGGELLIVTDNGYGKRTPLREFRVQARGGKGVKAFKDTEKNGVLAGACVVLESDSLMLVATSGKLIKLDCRNISSFNRNAQGTKIMNLKEGDSIQSLARILEE